MSISTKSDLLIVNDILFWGLDKLFLLKRVKYSNGCYQLECLERRKSYLNEYIDINLINLVFTSFRRPEKSYFSDFGKKSFATMGDNHLRRPFPVENEWRRSENNAYFIDFVPFLGQFMSNHRLKCLAEGLIVTKTSFHAGFWCLSRIKRSTRLPNRKTFGDVRHL